MSPIIRKAILPAALTIGLSVGAIGAGTAFAQVSGSNGTAHRTAQAQRSTTQHPKCPHDGSGSSSSNTSTN